MAGSKTSAEKAREEEKSAAADDMFGGAFGSAEDIAIPEEENVSISDVSGEESDEQNHQSWVSVSFTDVF